MRKLVNMLLIIGAIYILLIKKHPAQRKVLNPFTALFVERLMRILFV